MKADPKKHRVLMICYYCPPLGGGGVQRTSKFCKYLPAAGWEPLVVSVRPNRRNVIEQGIDLDLMKDLEGSRVVRTPSFELSMMYAMLYRMGIRKVQFELERLIPCLHMDYKIGWYPWAIRAAARAIREFEPQVVYTSSPPYAAHFSGLRISAKFGIPWVADFRDPWTQVATYRPPTRFHARLERGLERGILERADAVIANTDSNQRKIIEAFGLPAQKVQVIRNGFDPEDFAERLGGSKQRFVLSCIGKLYDMEDNSPLFRAFARIWEKESTALLRLYGPCPRRIRRTAEAVLEKGSYEFRGRVSHRNALTEMQRSTVLLANVPANADHWVPGKMYEYLAAGRPILFIGPQEGEAGELVCSTGRGIVVGNGEDEIYEALHTLYLGWKKGCRGWRAARTSIAEFERPRQAARLGELFSDLASKTARRK